MQTSAPSIDAAASSALDVDRTREQLALTLAALANDSSARTPVFALLHEFTIMRLDGADARSFLQGQVTADILALGDGGATMASYCTAKGRMLASFVAIRDGDALRLLVRSDLAAAFQKRLSMFVLRSKVKITLEADTRLIGVIGTRAAQMLESIGIRANAQVYAFARSVDGDPWGRLPGERVLGLVDASRAPSVVAALGRVGAEVGESCWRWVDIREGLTFIQAATQDQLTPQMANLELIGGVSFQKGCYPGQEIVARTQHLGKVKRRTYRAHAQTDQIPTVGEAVYAIDHGEQAAGIVLDVTPAPTSGFDLLISMISAAAESGRVTLGAPDGRPAAIEALPYALPA